jgi:hypothetical protein
MCVYSYRALLHIYINGIWISWYNSQRAWTRIHPGQAYVSSCLSWTESLTHCYGSKFGTPKFTETGWSIRKIDMPIHRPLGLKFDPYPYQLVGYMFPLYIHYITVKTYVLFMSQPSFLTLKLQPTSNTLLVNQIPVLWHISPMMGIYRNHVINLDYQIPINYNPMIILISFPYHLPRLSIEIFAFWDIFFFGGVPWPIGSIGNLHFPILSHPFPSFP